MLRKDTKSPFERYETELNPGLKSKQVNLSKTPRLASSLLSQASVLSYSMSAQRTHETSVNLFDSLRKEPEILSKMPDGSENGAIVVYRRYI